jgi:cell division protein FtsW
VSEQGGGAPATARGRATAAHEPPRGAGAGWLSGLLARPLASYYLLLSSCGLLLVIGLTMVFSATSVEALCSR